jgi:hypothetical protein
MADTIYASFADADMAQKAVGALLDHGVRCEDITFLANEEYGRRYGYDRVDAVDDDDDDHDRNPVASAAHGISTTTGADAASGAAKGAGIGLGLGAAAAIASMFIPGVGLVTGGGALASALAGLAASTAGGAAAGGATGYLKDQGVPEAAAMDYDKAIRSGGAMVAVTVPSNDVDRATAESVLAKYNAGNVNSYGMVR